MKLGPGEMATSEFQKAEARMLFLKAIASVAPEVLECLLADVFPSFNPDYRKLQLRHLPQGFRAALRQWASGFSLNYRWVYERAMATTDIWHSCPELTKERPLRWQMAWPAWWHPLPDVRDMQLDFAAHWDPTEEARTRAAARIREEFNRNLTAFMDEVEEKARRRGWGRALEKRNLKHFDWLVHYQVSGKNFGEISRFAYRGKKGYRTETRINIMTRIKELAAFIDLTLRQPNPPGRPRE